MVAIGPGLVPWGRPRAQPQSGHKALCSLEASRSPPSPLIMGPATWGRREGRGQGCAPRSCGPDALQPFPCRHTSPSRFRLGLTPPQPLPQSRCFPPATQAPAPRLGLTPSTLALGEPPSLHTGDSGHSGPPLRPLEGQRSCQRPHLLSCKDSVHFTEKKNEGRRQVCHPSVLGD